MRALLLLILSLPISVNAQSFLADFPPLYNYSLRVDSMAYLKASKTDYSLKYRDPNFSLGCRGPLPVQVEFSLILEHPFLYDTYQNFANGDEGDSYPSNFKLILHGLKKRNPEFDSLFRERIEDYCIYGQHNFYFETSDYFIFTYQHAFNGGGSVRYLMDLGMWAPVSMAIAEALAHKKLENESYAALDLEPDRAPEADFRGDYLMITYDRIPDSLSVEQILQLETAREISPRFLELKSNHRARSISNYNQPRSNWFRDKARWWRYKNYLYVWVEGWELKAYRILSPDLLLNLEHGYAFRRKEKD